MAIRVLITRKVDAGNQLAINDLLMKLRARAMQAKGYISGETLRALEDANEYLVISTWNTLEDWRRWEADEERLALQAKIDKLLRAPSTYRIYVYEL